MQNAAAVANFVPLHEPLIGSLAARVQAVLPIDVLVLGMGAGHAYRVALSRSAGAGGGAGARTRRS